MKIVGIAATLPSRVVSNEDVLQLIEHHSRNSFTGDLPKTLRAIRRLLERSGFESRRWLAQGESPIELMKATFDRALQQADMDKHEIDLLIYTGVARGFVEPANSCFVAHSLGLNCRNFDVLDACMGWVTSMDIVNDKMKAGAIKKAAIVNMEFNLVEGGHIFPKNFALNHPDELAYKFPSFTVGEATTVTLLSHEAQDNFHFSFINRPEMANRNFGAFRTQLHQLLGDAGGAGFHALHQFLKNEVYPTVADAQQWPEPDTWLATAKALYTQSERAVRGTYLPDTRA